MRLSDAFNEMIRQREAERFSPGTTRRRYRLSRHLTALVVLIAAVTTASLTFAGRSSVDIANDEVHRLTSMGVEIPSHSIVAVDWFRVDGFTAISTKPVRYVIVLPKRYWREAIVRRILAHEAYHVLADARGLDQSEELAEAFAYCMGDDEVKRLIDIDNVDCRNLNIEDTRL